MPRRETSRNDRTVVKTMTGPENLPVLHNKTADELTQTLYAKIPKWILAAMAAMGQESKAIEELTDLTAEAFKEGYSMGVNDTMNSIRGILLRAKVKPE